MSRRESPILVYRDVTYLGSHPALVSSSTPKPHDLHITEEGLLFVRGRRELGGIPWTSVTDIFADDRDGVERRVTVARVLTMGVLAWVAKKEREIAYLVVEDGDGDWIFAVPGYNSMRLAASIASLDGYFDRPRALPPPAPAPGAGRSIAERLAELTALADAGVITPAEHDRKRAEILDAL